MKKKVTSLLLALVMCLGLCIPAFAMEACGYEEYQDFTGQEIANIALDNAKIEAALKNTGVARAGQYIKLDVPLYQQETTNYCGPACTQMVLAYKGKNYTQSQIASAMNFSVGGADSSKIASVLNSKLGLNNAYSVTTTNQSTLSTDMIYSMQKDYPMICSVKTMPKYTSSSGHFLVLTGFNFGASGSQAVQTVYYNDPHWNDAYCEKGNMTYSEMLTAINSNGSKYIRYRG